MSSGRKRRLPLIIDFAAPGAPTWDEFRRIWTGQTVTLECDDGKVWTGELDGRCAVDPGCADRAVFVLELGFQSDVMVGCDSVVKAVV